MELMSGIREDDLPWSQASNKSYFSIGAPGSRRSSLLNSKCSKHRNCLMYGAEKTGKIVLPVSDSFNEGHLFCYQSQDQSLLTTANQD